MSGARLWEVLCDYEDDSGQLCDDGAGIGAFTTLTQARAEAKKAGWSVSQPGGQDFCPEHRPVRS